MLGAANGRLQLFKLPSADAMLTIQFTAWMHQTMIDLGHGYNCHRVQIAIDNPTWPLVCQVKVAAAGAAAA